MARQERKEVLTGPEPTTGICDTVINAEIDRCVAKNILKSRKALRDLKQRKLLSRIWR